jgi:hypothetical protein
MEPKPPHIVVFLTSHTSPNAATIDCTRSTEFQSSDGGKLGIRLPYQTRSTHCRRCRTACRPCGATNRRADTGYAEVLTRRASALPQSHGQAQWWEHQLLDSSFWLTEFSLLRRSRSDSPRSHALFSPEYGVLDRHAEQHVLVLLIVGGKASWCSMTVSTSGAHPREVRKRFLMVAISLDSRCIRSSSLMVMFYHSERKPLVVVRHMVDSRAHGIAPHE